MFSHYYDDKKHDFIIRVGRKVQNFFFLKEQKNKKSERNET